MLRNVRIRATALGAVSMLIGAFSSTAQAHHSFAMFDASKCSSVVGTVVKFTMDYPHAFLWVVVPGADGSATTWAFEGADPTSLRLRGWSKAALNAGDKVQVAYSPLKDGRPGGAVSEVLLPNGKILEAPKVAIAGGLAVCEVSKAKAR